MGTKRNPTPIKSETLYQLETRSIQLNPDQPRKYFDPDAFEQLKASIQKNKILNPVLVMEADDKSVILVAGERRFRAAQDLGIEKIPAIFVDGDPLELALIENSVRQDLNSIELAETLLKLKKKFNYKDEDLSACCGKKRATVTEILSINKLPDEIKEECRNNSEVSQSLLVEIAKEQNSKKMISLFKKAKEKGLTKNQIRLSRQKAQNRSKFAVSLDTVKKLKNQLSKVGQTDSWEDKEKEKFKEELASVKEKIEAVLDRL